MKQNINKPLYWWSRWLHSWGAIIISLPLILIISTGVLLIIKKQSSWVQPPSQKGISEELTLSFAEVISVAQTVKEANINDWSDIDRVDVRPSKGMLKVRAKNSYEIQIDTKTGEILQVAYRRSELIEGIHDGSFFHDWVKMGIFFPSALILLLLWITGLYLFFRPAYIRRVKREKARIVR
jgi:uncharacterized iron-regulated membrane protein